MMMLEIIKTKIYFLSIFHFSYHGSEEVQNLFLVCHVCCCFIFFLAAAEMLGIMASYQPFAFCIIQKPSI